MQRSATQIRFFIGLFGFTLVFIVYAAAREVADLFGHHAGKGLDVFFLVLLAFPGAFTGLRIHFLRQELRERLNAADPS